jgi:hypothetical protein
MYYISREQAGNFWQYCKLAGALEMQFYALITKMMVGGDNRLCIDEVAKDTAEYLAEPINYLNPPEDGENCKAACILHMARAYVTYLRDVVGNDRFMNAGSFFLICTRIAKHVK